MMAEPQVNDSHPQLSERLASMGYLAQAQGEIALGRMQAPSEKSKSAAQVLLSGQMSELVSVLEQG